MTTNNFKNVTKVECICCNGSGQRICPHCHGNNPNCTCCNDQYLVKCDCCNGTGIINVKNFEQEKKVA